MIVPTQPLQETASQNLPYCQMFSLSLATGAYREGQGPEADDESSHGFCSVTLDRRQAVITSHCEFSSVPHLVKAD